MLSISQFLNKISNWKTLLFFFLVYMSFNAYFLKNAEEKINSLSGNKIGVIDLTFGFDVQKTLGMVAAYSAEARSFYARTELTTDILYPIVYAFFFGIILTLLFKNKTYAPSPWINILPFISLVFDYLENICIVTLLNAYPKQNYTMAVLCELVKLCKWIVFGLILILILYGLIRFVISKLTKQV
jgi:hypothetical protein